MLIKRSKARFINLQAAHLTSSPAGDVLPSRQGEVATLHLLASSAKSK
ncbi:hypothetical protein KCP76_10730 [Salmonella enterica subsp. enterica serovar Weltevreden]|nr:hypothetical protein KCP76_10730 [Salmonella enterica subsp. enterica serovar Weltevreden]